MGWPQMPAYDKNDIGSRSWKHPFGECILFHLLLINLQNTNYFQDTFMLKVKMEIRNVSYVDKNRHYYYENFLLM